MTPKASIRGIEKAQSAPPLSVGVIASPLELRCALRMRRPPHLFELRLDALSEHLDEVQRVAASLPAPLIITARDPREGGLHQLSPRQRCDLLLRFMSFATYVDVELQSVRMLRSVLEHAESIDVRRIISVHNFDATPKLSTLMQLIDSAKTVGADILKVATRTETVDELARLLEFFDRASEHLPVSAMGIGKLARHSRRLLARRGSVLNYAYLRSAEVEGQMSLAALRRTMARSGGPRRSKLHYFASTLAHLM